MNKNEVLPFLKWAGGKRWLMQKEYIQFNGNHTRYIEPFLGSGAVFFALHPPKGILADKNGWLIDAYKAIKDDWRKVLVYLREHSRKHSKEYYYKVRQSHPKTSFTRAAKLIYLNRTCFNGLFRVNLNGKFNVPKGSKNKVIMDTDNFEAVARCLKNFRLICSDFEKIIDQAQNGDLVFADPPYTIKHDQNSFIKYNEHLFEWEDQLRLQSCLERAKDRGVKLILTNAHHKSIRNLYGGSFKVKTIKRISVISGDKMKRCSCNEYLITANIPELL